MANVTNGTLKKLIDSLNERVVEALNIWKEAAVTVIALHADVKDLAAEVSKQTALAVQEHKRLTENDAVHTSDIKEMREMIKGNGKPGIETNIATIATELNNLKRLLYFLLAPIYAGLIAIGFTLVQANMHIASASTVTPPPIVVTMTPPASYFTHIPVDKPTATQWQR